MSALLARDEEAAQTAVDVGERRLGDRGGTVEGARMRLALLRGGPSRAEPGLGPGISLISFPTLHHLAKEAIAAGQASIALETVRALAKTAPERAVLASIEAAVSQDEDTWHDALQTGADHGLRLIVVDALEGLATAASRSESWAECLRLYGAAQRLRDECDYRWRFDFEQKPIDQALAAARAGLAADAADAEGRALSWPDAVRYATRARGERKRPRHGWASLTPTEEQVLALVAEGLTNPQIGARLLMGRATVKTHIEHIFAKVGVTSRTELATQAARRHT
jgi:DNA-binding CsgD family transcriptional regulator